MEMRLKQTSVASVEVKYINVKNQHLNVYKTVQFNVHHVCQKKRKEKKEPRKIESH